MLSKSLVSDVLAAALENGGDFAELFVEDRYGTNLMMVADRLDSGISGRDARIKSIQAAPRTRGGRSGSGK